MHPHFRDAQTGIEAEWRSGAIVLPADHKGEPVMGIEGSEKLRVHQHSVGVNPGGAGTGNAATVVGINEVMPDTGCRCSTGIVPAQIRSTPVADRAKGSIVPVVEGKVGTFGGPVAVPPCHQRLLTNNGRIVGPNLNRPIRIYPGDGRRSGRPGIEISASRKGHGIDPADRRDRRGTGCRKIPGDATRIRPDRQTSRRKRGRIQIDEHGRINLKRPQRDREQKASSYYGFYW